MVKRRTSSFVIKAKDRADFNNINRLLNSENYIAIDFLKQGGVKNISLGGGDPAEKGAQGFGLCVPGLHFHWHEIIAGAKEEIHLQR